MFESAIDALNKKFKKKKSDKGVVYDPNRTFDVISSGDPFLDKNLGGGLAVKGRLTQIASFESGGKTTLALQSMFEALKKYPDEGAIFVDAEGHLDPVYMDALSNKILGTDYPRDRVLILQPDSGEDADSALTLLFNPKKFEVPKICMLVIDSVAAVRPMGLMNEDIAGSSQKAQHASFWSDFAPKLNHWAVKHDLAVILINQLRAKLSMGFMDKFKLSNTGLANTGTGATADDLIATGGNALKYYLSKSYVIKFTSKHKIEDIDPATGEVVKIEVANKYVINNVKDKTHLPYLKSPFMISFGLGTVNLYQAIDWAKESGLITSKGHTYSLTIDGTVVLEERGKVPFNLSLVKSPTKELLVDAFVKHLKSEDASTDDTVDLSDGDDANSELPSSPGGVINL